MTGQKRPYRLRERAKSQEETRQKIVEATMHLHEEIGPRATTISAIAERSGVQRLTVYRHFPDETAVFQACTSHWLSLNPPPESAEWSGLEDPRARFEAAVAAFYAYFSRTRRMWTVSYEDVAHVPALQGPMAEFAAYLDGVSKGLLAAFDGAADMHHIAPTVRHALRFQTWANLEDQGLDDRGKVALVSHWLCCPERG
ncbi:TetR/AcrR family transcriptional regulator [Silicimonas algicola]|uniref:TetR family transcriptional regulator n=1 Tax=Silicimonas algicola TaxID=1826607 RepID=A0A316FY38_9RHOB|nr:TetR/AcrR family transcriptional regulator [Silicimonas algicola]PWK53509.1 TetR family transcriptional regulator [Silicimonas algicola]